MRVNSINKKSTKTTSQDLLKIVKKLNIKNKKNVMKAREDLETNYGRI
jgi:hypothetical protein